ncbi:MAG: sigma-70 family RNA polymerase sigma factor [Planctomycetes bacterium]|nr:sigma-70 family RNA polymerase sigma factor [Planctomycetota bacterium]
MWTRETDIGGPAFAFQATLWTQVLKAGDPAHPDAREALERLIGLYWKPVYFFLRRKGHSVEDSKDLTQAFFARLLERGTLGNADPARGKFRTYLLGALEYFLRDERDRRCAQKRQASFDFATAETHFRPEHTFERDWAFAVLERAFVRLKEERPEQASLAAALRGEAVPYAELAGAMGTTEANVKVLVHRARKRLREILVEELRSTVQDDAQVQAELGDLFRAFSL